MNKIINKLELDEMTECPSEENFILFFTAPNAAYEQAFTYGGWANPCVDDGLKEALSPEVAFKLLPFSAKILLEQIDLPSIKKSLHILDSLIQISKTTEINLAMRIPKINRG